MDRTAETFARYVSALQFEDLTPAAVHAAKRSLIDSIGCALGAFHAEPCIALRKLAARTSALKPATIIGTDIRSAPEYAALANSGMIRYLDFSDDYFGGTGNIGPHPSDNIGGVLAATQAAGTDGRALILGMAVAYEACGQFVDNIRTPGAKPTWDYTVLHAIATSLGAGKVLGLSREQLRHALAIAAVSNVSVQQTRLGELSNWKGIAGPNGSRSGLFAAMLAQEGITGPDEPFDGKAGLLKHLQAQFELGALGGEGAAFRIERTYYKFLPIRYSAQLMVAVALELRTKAKSADIASICVYVPKRYVSTREDFPEYWNPTTRETSDHSFPFLIGAALVDGKVDEETFSAERFRDPSILALIDKVSMAEDAEYSKAFPGQYDVRFDVTLKSGERLSVHQANPKGHPLNPMSDAEIEAKFLGLAETTAVPRQQCRALLDALWALERQSDIGRLFSLMRVPA